MLWCAVHVSSCPVVLSDKGLCNLQEEEDNGKASGHRRSTRSRKGKPDYQAMWQVKAVSLVPSHTAAPAHCTYHSVLFSLYFMLALSHKTPPVRSEHWQCLHCQLHRGSMVMCLWKPHLSLS